MIILSSTESYLKWLDIFLPSFKYYNGDLEKIVLNTLNCSLKITDTYKKMYPNLVTNNTDLSLEKIAKKVQLPIERIIKSKNGCEGAHKENHRLWMNFFADGFRIEKLYETIVDYPNEEYYIHMDIDALFRGKINEIYESIKKSDINLVYRGQEGQNLNEIKHNVFQPDAKLSDSKLYIAIMGINNTENGKNFIKSWIENINSAPFGIRNKWKWGQYTALKTFNEYKNTDTKISRVPRIFYSGKHINEFPEASIWFIKQKAKSEGILKAKKEFKRLLNESKSK